MPDLWHGSYSFKPPETFGGPFQPPPVGELPLAQGIAARILPHLTLLEPAVTITFWLGNELLPNAPHPQLFRVVQMNHPPEQLPVENLLPGDDGSPIDHDGYILRWNVRYHLIVRGATVYELIPQLQSAWAYNIGNLQRIA